MNIGVTGNDSTLTSSERRRCERERPSDQERLRNFDPLTSRAWQTLKAKLDIPYDRKQILCLCNVISYHLKIPIPRECVRRKNRMILWIEDNYDMGVSDFLDHLIDVSIV